MKTVLCYGDSNTYGYIPETSMRYPREIRYPGVLQRLLGDEYAVIEEGCNGRTTIYGESNEEWKNGLDYLKPCLNSHKPIDIVVMMLGSNDLKTFFDLTAEKIAYGAGVLVDTIQEFMPVKQGYVPKILLIAPPEIGENIRFSPFYGEFDENSITESRRFPECYRALAQEKGCLYLNAAEYITPSDYDSLHLTPEGHRILAEKVAEMVRGI